MPSRNWNVPIDLPERMQAGMHDPVDVSEAQQAFLDAEALLRNVGGMVQAAPHRVNIGEDRWITVGYSLHWDSFAPGMRKDPSIVEDVSEEIEPESVEA